MIPRRLFLAKLAVLAGYPLLAKAGCAKPLSLPVVFTSNGKTALTIDANGQPSTPIDYDRLLYCISAVETGHDDTVVGPCGARSRYQISEGVWLQHMDLLGGNLMKYPHAKCSDWRARYVAGHHLAWLEMTLTPRASVYSLAFCWKEGLEAYRLAHSNRASMSNYSHESYVRGMEYSRRVTNLYASGYNET